MGMKRNFAYFMINNRRTRSFLLVSLTTCTLLQQSPPCELSLHGKKVTIQYSGRGHLLINNPLCFSCDPWPRRPSSAFEASGRNRCTVERTERFQVAPAMGAPLRQPGACTDLFSEAGGTAGPPQLLSPPAALHRLTAAAAAAVTLPLFLPPGGFKSRQSIKSFVLKSKLASFFLCLRPDVKLWKWVWCLVDVCCSAAKNSY